MIERRSAGGVPPKPHTVFRGADGALRHEECLTRNGFDGAYTMLYHLHAPHTHRREELRHGYTLPTRDPSDGLAKRHYRTQDLPRSTGPACDSRMPMLFNDDVTVSVLSPNEDDPLFLVNGDGDDLYFIHEGGGVCITPLGDLRFDALDYLCIPRGVAYRFVPDPGPQRWLQIECRGGLHLPKQWRNDVGQLRMDAPFCHRDFQAPIFAGPQDDGLREILVKRNDAWHGFSLNHSPLDVVGWDGAVYPFTFPILAFQPRAGQVHLPPTWHGTFGARGALVCSFVPRVVDFHPDAIPCPYPHSSVDMDEMIYYCDGNFTSRKGVGPGSLSHHPAGIAHGPHPGAYEASIGTARTDELAVMLDTLKPLHRTSTARAVEDGAYHDSFIP